MKKLLSVVLLSMFLFGDSQAGVIDWVAHFNATTYKPLGQLYYSDDVYYKRTIFATKIKSLAKPKPDVSPAICDENQGSCFQVFYAPMSYLEAKGLCEYQGAHLANPGQFSFKKFLVPQMEAEGAKYVVGFYLGTYMIANDWTWQQFGTGYANQTPTAYLWEPDLYPDSLPTRIDFISENVFGVYDQENRGTGANYSTSMYRNGWRYNRGANSLNPYHGAACEWNSGVTKFRMPAALR